MIRILLAGMLTLCANTVHAQDTLPTRLLPAYTPCEVDGVRFSCYTLEQQRELNMLEVDARSWHRHWRASEQLRLDMSALLLNLEEQVQQLRSIADIRAENITNLVQQLNAAVEAKNRYRAEAEQIDVWPLLLGGALALVAVGVMTGVLVAADL